MRFSLLSIVAACLSVQTGLAVFLDDAFQVDYHLALLGTPLQHTTFFHEPNANSRASLIYTLSDKGIIGAVNPRDGSLVWRQNLGRVANSTNSHLRAGEGQDVVISALESEVTAWSAADGRQVWSVGFGEAVQDLEILELDEGRDGVKVKDALILSGETRPKVVRISAATGETKWTFVDESGDVPYQVSASTTEVFYITLHTTMLGGHKIKITSLDAHTGKKTNEYSLSSEGEVSSINDILSVGANTASPIIAWIDSTASTLKINIIGTKTVSSFPIEQAKGQSIKKIVFHAPYYTNARSHFLVHFQTAEQHWAEVYHIDQSASKVSKAYSLPKLAGKGSFSTSSSGANVYFTRISEGEVSVVSSASHGILSRWPISSMGVVAKDAIPVHAVSEVSVKGDTVSASRSAVLLSSGDWIAVRDGQVSWQRPEALAHTIAAVWAYPPVDPTIVDDLRKEAHSSVLTAYVHRVQRHIADLEHLPAFLRTVPSTVLHSLGIGEAPADTNTARQNSFGYHKIIVCATDNGRLIGLDAGSSGNIMWNIQSAEEGDKGQTMLYSLPDGTVLKLAQTQAGQLREQINATTGQKVPEHFAITKPDVQFSLSQAGSSEEVHGYSQEGGSPLWTFKTKGDEEIITMVSRPLGEPVASIGKVLGDRSVLYKYVNPNLLLIATGSKKARTITISIVDSALGSVLYSTKHEDVDLNMPFAATASENWFAYSLTVDTAGSEAKGYQLTIGELYESSIPNDRGPMLNASQGSALGYQPHVALQTFVIPEPISHLSVSQTTQGITSKELLAVLPESNAILGIPRAILDARRPVGRNPSKDEQFEGLMQYAPLLEFDAKWLLTHSREVIGVNNITTSPALLESTSLVFAYGLDIFGTRISPSFSFDVLGKDFNKLQMLATVIALFIGTLIVAPMVARKQVNARWQFSS
ncbi:hypothetical protein MBLNU457_1519t1 [Dothideomycetes sp. NU457]